MVLHFLRHPIGLESVRDFFIQSQASNQNQSEANPKPIRTHSHAFPALYVSYMCLIRVLIGSLYCPCSLWLARKITLVLDDARLKTALWALLLFFVNAMNGFEPRSINRLSTVSNAARILREHCWWLTFQEAEPWKWKTICQWQWSDWFKCNSLLVVMLKNSGTNLVAVF